MYSAAPPPVCSLYTERKFRFVVGLRGSRSLCGVHRASPLSAPIMGLDDLDSEEEEVEEPTGVLTSPPVDPAPELVVLVAPGSRGDVEPLLWHAGCCFQQR